MELINLTPHTVHLITTDGEVVEIPTSGLVARVDTTRNECGTIRVGPGNVPIIRIQSCTAINGLPAPAAGITHVVSQQVAAARPDRHDLAFPADPERSPDGIVIGARGLGSASSTPPNT